MHYHVVFDVGQAGYRYWWSPAVGLIFILVGALMWRFSKQVDEVQRVTYFGLSRPGPEFIKTIGAIVLAFAAAWTFLALGLTLTDYLSLRSAVRNRECKIVEGIVENFDPMPAEGHKDESFVVSGERFQYSDYDITAGFNRSRSHGGPIENGIRVRIYYVKAEDSRNEIARLEIAD